MSDLIDREQAKDAIDKYLVGRNLVTDGTMMARLINEIVIDRLPSAQPKRGKWILDRSGAYCCSECMEPCTTYVMMKPRDRFCKMCGAKMEVTT